MTYCLAMRLNEGLVFLADIRAVRIALGSMMSTAQANPSVGPPYDVGICLNHAHGVKQYRFESDSPLLARLRESWERHLLSGTNFRRSPTRSSGAEAGRPGADRVGT